MNSYVTGGTIKRLREGRRLTQARLAELLGVTDKAVSRWETGRGLPDLTLLEPLAKALGISVPELLCSCGQQGLIGREDQGHIRLDAFGGKGLYCF